MMRERLKDARFWTLLSALALTALALALPRVTLTRDVYEARSPIHHTDGFAAPLIVLQGSEDEVVPPNQAEMIVSALAERDIPHAYVLFEGEQHGFRRAENIVRALEAELWFYGRVFGFDPADDIEPVDGAVGL